MDYERCFYYNKFIKRYVEFVNGFFVKYQSKLFLKTKKGGETIVKKVELIL